ncbi:MAG: hypothetical protein JWN04_5407 [Myxococcaceae bacterium]|nr:hypothetical protein [Myxococcaceae bacterium]
MADPVLRKAWAGYVDFSTQVTGVPRQSRSTVTALRRRRSKRSLRTPLVEVPNVANRAAIQVLLDGPGRIGLYRARAYASQSQLVAAAGRPRRAPPTPSIDWPRRRSTLVASFETYSSLATQHSP